MAAFMRVMGFFMEVETFSYRESVTQGKSDNQQISNRKTHITLK